MPLDTPVRVVRELARRGYNAEREAVTLLANAPDPEAAIERAIERAPDDALTLRIDLVRDVTDATPANPDTDVSSGSKSSKNTFTERGIPVEEKGVDGSDGASGSDADETGRDTPGTGGAKAATATTAEGSEGTTGDTDGAGRQTVEIANDVTGRSTGTGTYGDFVATFRDRYERLGGLLRSRVNHRPTTSLSDMTGGSEVGLVGMIADIRSTRNGHWLLELEDTSGTFPCLITADTELAGVVDELLLDEVVAVEGRLSDDGGVLFADSLHFPDVPRTYEPSTADRQVQAALVSDVHVGSEEFLGDAWSRFADWLHTPEADPIEYLLIGGDMVEGVGVYPDQDEELEIVDIYDQYAAFSERLKEVPGDLEIVMIPGNHDAVRLAEPQPAFDEELRSIMSAHDARFTGNPSTVTIEGVSVLMYHGVSLDEVIAEVPAASYDAPHEAMYHLLRKRHLAPQFGERTRVAPEERDYLVIDEVPDVFHAGHVHTLGYGRYHNVTVINSACWQRQTGFQRQVNLDPDVGYAPILDLDTLDVTIRKFT